MDNKPFTILIDHRSPKTDTNDTEGNKSNNEDAPFIPLDDEDLIVGLLAAHGLKSFLFAETNGRKLKVCFPDTAEIKDILKRIQSAKMGVQVEPVMVNYNRVCEARKLWRELLQMMRSQGD